MTGDQAYATMKNYIKDTLAGAGALKGEPGKSAYQVAIERGFIGTEEDWLASLKGKDGAAKVFDFAQSTPSDIWMVTHSLACRYPHVTCVDDGGNTIVGDIEYFSDNVTIIRFSEPVKGTAHLTQGGSIIVGEIPAVGPI